MLTSLALLFLCGLLAGGLCTRLHLPSLLGMLAVGLLLGPQVLGVLDDSLLTLSPVLRQVALIIILAKAGLSLDLDALRQARRPAVLLCFLPATFEIIGCILLAPPLLGVSALEGAVIGSVVAAVSPAVVVPRMLRLIAKRQGTQHAIPQMVLAGASVDDVFVIVMLTVTTGLAAGGDFSVLTVLTVPISVALGLLTGVLCGALLCALFGKLHMRDSVKVLLLFSVSFLLTTAETALKAHGIALSAMLGVMAMGVTILRRDTARATRLADKFGKLWVGAELLLFTLVGAAVQLPYLATAGIAAVVLVFGALSLRMVGVFACVSGTVLTWRERVFTAIAYTPKATVQAAIGGVPLAMGLACGNLALTVAVLSIVLTAPLGAFFIDHTAAHLLATEQ